jgi:hypothetical protein
MQNYNFACMGVNLTLTEERRVRVFENMLLRRNLGYKRDEVTGERRKLHNEGLNDLCCLLNIVLMIKSRRMRWAWRVTGLGVRRGFGGET